MMEDKQANDTPQTTQPNKSDNETANANEMPTEPNKRYYTMAKAHKLLDLHRLTVERAARKNLFESVPDEKGARIPIDEINAILKDLDWYERIASDERIKIEDIAEALDQKTVDTRKALKKLGLSQTKPAWGEIRGQWGLPNSLSAFRQLIHEKRNERRKNRRAQRDDRKRKLREQQESERLRRAELRAQLVASFPAWSAIDRSHQTLLLHIGPPNSGKTHEALNRLAEVGTGWYLAPLRLLAWEIFERLNQRGVPCNLLTGEEFVPVEGAEITAATIEMFNPIHSGDVVIIDEAQMLADADRGWAWTRALMQCHAPEMHIIAPPTAELLIKKMAEAAKLPIETVVHERLAPIEIAKSPWTLKSLPARTILVAFSRKMVLTLKTRLEKMGRSVSVVYGSLPPEVRRKQAERFASGETEICIATDAVGMGLNLPADNVCFFEVEKYDGRDIRTLVPAEVQQIGGRAGRFGISQAGLIGATSPADLKILKRLFYEDAEILTHARVAPSVDDVQMIPGSLSKRLEEWGQLQSIPEDLRNSIKTADLTERIELAGMLSDAQVVKLGLQSALQLVNAPTRKSTREFWHACALAIIDRAPMPLPPMPPDEIFDTETLDNTETCISCADIYLWLSQRREFREFAEHVEIVRTERVEWSERIDDALLKKIRTTYMDDNFRF